MESSLIFITISTLICSGIFSGIETAFLASDKLIVKLEGNKRSLNSKALSFLINNPSLILGTTLILTTISIVICGSALAEIFQLTMKPFIPLYLDNAAVWMLSETLVTTFLILIFAEFIPKSIFILNPNRFLEIFAIPIVIVTSILYPIVSSIIFISKFVIKNIFKQQYVEKKPAFELKDFQSFLKKTLDDDNSPTLMRAKMATNLIEFRKIRVRDCMVPRTEAVAIEAGSSLEDLKKVFIEKELSKILIYKTDIDNIIGYCVLKDLLKKPTDIQSIIKPILIITETVFASELMIKFIYQHKSIALVVDEFGGTSGIITMEDIIEEIFGEILDEFDSEDLVEKSISEDEYIFSARLEINYLNEKYQLNIPKGEYETLGGYVIEKIGELPKDKDIFKFENLVIQIISMKRSHINLVQLKKIDDSKLE